MLFAAGIRTTPGTVALKSPHENGLLRHLLALDLLSVSFKLMILGFDQFRLRAANIKSLNFDTSMRAQPIELRTVLDTFNDSPQTQFGTHLK